MKIVRIASDYFEYSRGERLSILSFLFLLALTYSAPSVIRCFQPLPPVDFTEFQAAFESLDESIAEFTPEEYKQVSEPALRPFDPNTATQDEFLQLGVPEYLAERIVNYRSKGGRFRSPEDLGKIYGIKPGLVERLIPYVRIEQTKRNPRTARAARPTPAPTELFPFDPNTVSASDLQRLGLSKRTARQIVNYREKGGQFRRVEDFQKIYALSETDYERLRPYVQIEEQRTPDSAKPIAAKKIAPVPVPTFTGTIEINTAGPEVWEQLPGIGPYYAKKIVRFREVLGGFRAVEQIGETYNLPDSVFQRILPQLQLVEPHKKIAVNQIGPEVLRTHPYLSSKQARSIVRFREQNGPITTVSFERLRGPLGENYEKILPYLSFESVEP